MACSITISERNDAPDKPWGSSGRRQSAAARNGLATVRYLLAAVALAAAAALSLPARAQTADDLAKNYSKEAMEQALQTKQRFDLYGLHFESEQSAINADGKSLLDDIATALKNFPDWGLRIVGHTDATADPQHNEALSLDRANAIKAALVERGLDPQRLLTAGAGESSAGRRKQHARGASFESPGRTHSVHRFRRSQETAQVDVRLSSRTDGDII